MVAGTGAAAIAAVLIWMATGSRFQPEARVEPVPPSTPATPIDSTPGTPDTALAPIQTAAPDNTLVPGAADSIFAADTLARIFSGPDTTMPPADLERLIRPGTLAIPVAGITAGKLQDTYSDARSEGRVHNAIDIMAPGGTPVIAAADGKIVKLFSSERGGITIYELAPNNRVVYYYAHLERYADGLAEGQTVRRGETIAYVGDTGNAGPGNYHLHFEISIVNDARQYWGGVPINPYPILRGAAAE
jgi:murein DD-endopeptidase MepM/ murein hydrolase activator NlpD